MGLSVVSKRDLWNAEALLPEDLERPDSWHLKNIQDAIAFELLWHANDQTIIEIGGGRSRLLPWLGRKNRCILADPLDGRDGGPTAPPVEANYDVVREALVLGTPMLDRYAGCADYVFSISVVEHIPVDGLGGFFEACHALLRPGGRMIHLIDYYISDDGPNTASLARLDAYLAPLQRGFCPIDETLEPSELHFESWMATNPDNFMSRWNQSVPQLKPVRETHQSVALLMHYSTT